MEGKSPFDQVSVRYHQGVISCRSYNTNLYDFLLIVRHFLWFEDEHSDLVVCWGDLSTFMHP